jgi:hypothetical protein
MNGEQAGDHDAQLREAIAAVEKSLDADVFFFCGNLRPPMCAEFVDLVNEECSRPNVLLMLATYGGSAETAYRICRCLQRHYPQEHGKITLFVDSFCKSAGTLIALGVDELVMSEAAELGPLDVQLSKPDELEEWMSGLTPIQALATLRTEAFKTFEQFFLDIRRRSGFQITTRTAANIAARLATGLFSRIYEQLDPMRLGEYGLAMMIAENYGTRLARSNLQEESLSRLIADYPTHDFVIDRDEAGDLFQRVRAPTSEEERLAQLLRPLVGAWLRSGGRTIIEHLSSKKVKASEEEQHGEVESEPGEVPPKARSGTRRAPRADTPKSAAASDGTEDKKGGDGHQD